MFRARLAGIGIILLVLLALLYWLLPVYVLPAMDITRQPAEYHEPAAVASPVTSYVAIPLTLSVEKIKKMVLEQLSGKLLANQLQIPERDLKITIERNGRVALWVHDAEMHLVYPIRFQARGDLRAKGKLTLFTRASFNISRDWEPQVDVRSTFHWDKEPRVGVWPFRFRIGDVLAPFIQLALDKGSREFSSKANGIYNIRAIAQSGWERMRGPHLLDAEANTWFLMQPREIYLEPITSDRNNVSLNLWVASELAVTEGAEPIAADEMPLPPLRHGEPPAKTMVLSAPLTVTYEHMLASLRGAVVGKQLASTSNNLIVTDLEMYSSGQNVVLGVAFEGTHAGNPLPVRGRVFLTGTPVYDTENSTLSIRKLYLTHTSNNLLTLPVRSVLEEAPAWIAEIGPRMSWDTSELIEEHHQKLDRHLNRTVDRRFDLWGDVNEVIVTGAVPQAEGIMLQAQGRGDLQLMFMP